MEVTGSFYEIRIQNHLDENGHEGFEGMTIAHGPNGEVVLTGLFVDQSALIGLLGRVLDLNLKLISVRQIPVL